MTSFNIVRIDLVAKRKDGTILDHPFWGIRLAVPAGLTGDTVFPDLTLESDDGGPNDMALSQIRPGDSLIADISVSKDGEPVEKDGKSYQNYRAFVTGDSVKFKKRIRPTITVE